jgi:hypothetical protein
MDNYALRPDAAPFRFKENRLELHHPFFGRGWDSHSQQRTGRRYNAMIKARII